MPITINDCAYCGELPNFDFDPMGDGYADLILYCHCSERAKYHEAKRGDLKEAVNAWNKLNNPARSEAGNA